MTEALADIPRNTRSLEILRRSVDEIKAGERNGNFALVTSARLRRVVASMNPEATKSELMSGMGISADVTPMESGMMIEVITPQSLQTVMSALRSTFDVLGAMGRNGRMAVKVMIPKEHKLS